MSKKINPRVISWTMTLLVLAVVVFVYYSDNPQKPVQTPVTISEAAIKIDFIEMKNIKVPIEPTLGGQFMTDELLFPAGFKGEVGSNFYARLEDGHVLTTVQYRIKSLTAGPPVEAVYEPVKNLAADFTPAGEYEVRSIERYSLKGQGK